MAYFGFDLIDKDWKILPLASTVVIHDRKLIVSQNWHDQDSWVVTEPESGFKIGSAPSHGEAVTLAGEMLLHFGVDKTDEAIMAAKTTTGWYPCPYYEEVAHDGH